MKQTKSKITSLSKTPRLVKHNSHHPSLTSNWALRGLNLHLAESLHKAAGGSDFPLVWVTRPWSPCSKSCGLGSQTRTVTCTMSLTERNLTHQVRGARQQVPRLYEAPQMPDSFCEGGAERPDSVRRCGSPHCHTWIRSPWGPCGDCVSNKTGRNYKILLEAGFLQHQSTIHVSCARRSKFY